MSSPFRHLFRTNGQNSAAELASNEDIECGHPSSVLSNSTSSGCHSSSRGVVLPGVLNISGTLLSGGDDNRYVRYNGQHGSAAQLPLTSSGLSRVIGYLPRTTCDSPTPFVTPTGLDVPSQNSLSSNDGDWMGSSGAQCRSSSVPSLAFHKSLSPRPPFDPRKHGPALQRLEARGSLKTIPSGQWDGSAFIRSSFSWLGTQQGVFQAGHAAKYKDSHSGQLADQLSANTDEKSNQQMVFDLSLPPGHFPANNLNHSVVLNQENLSAVVNLPNTPDVESVHVFRKPLPALGYPLPNSQADSSSQRAQQESHLSQVPPNFHKIQHSNSKRGKNVGVVALPDLQSKSPSSKRMLEHDKTGRMTGSFSVEEREKQGFAEIPVQEQARQACTILSSPVFDGIDEFLWSPAPSEDGQEVPSIPHTPTSYNIPSDVLLSSPTSGIASESDGDVYKIPLPQIDVPIPAGKINFNSHKNFLSSSQQVSTVGLGESSSMLFRYSGIIMDDPSSRPMSEIELKEKMTNLPEDRPAVVLSTLSSMESTHQVNQSTSFEQIREEHEPNAESQTFPSDQVQNPSADAGPGSSQTSSSMSTPCYGGDLSGHKVRSGICTLPTSRARCHTPPLLFGKSAIRGSEMFDAASNLAPGITTARFNQNVKAVKPNESGGLPIALNSSGEQDWETISAGTEAYTQPFGSISCNARTGSSLADNSDSGNLSLSKEVHHPSRSIKSRPVMQHLPHPRHNYSFVLLKNSQTGDFVPVPQYGHVSGGCLLNNNISSQIVSTTSADNSYRHPSPLQAVHTRPITSSPPIICSRNSSAFNNENGCLWVRHSHFDSDSSSSGLSEGVQRVKEEQTQDLSYKTTEDTLSVPGAAISQDQRKLGFRQQSCQSSAWLSTVSEVISSELSFPRGRDSLVKTIVRNSSGHVDSTSEQRNNLDLESSLTDTRSLVSDLSRSSERIVNSPAPFSDILPSSSRKLHKQTIQQNLEISSQGSQANFHRSLERPWDRFKPRPLRQRPNPKPLGLHLIRRPVAQAESPHLHSIPRNPTIELLERQVLISRIYLVTSMVVPPIALVYGHGYMDSLMRLHTAGQIHGFRTTEKTIALCWGYGVSAICILAVIIAISIMPASA